MKNNVNLIYVLTFCRFWPDIDDALRAAAIDRHVKIKLLVSKWNHTRNSMNYFLRSLSSLSKAYRNVDIQVVSWILYGIHYCFVSALKSLLSDGYVNHVMMYSETQCKFSKMEGSMMSILMCQNTYNFDQCFTVIPLRFLVSGYLPKPLTKSESPIEVKVRV